MTLSDDFSNYDIIKVVSTSGTHNVSAELVAPLETSTNYTLHSTAGGMAWVTFNGPRKMYLNFSGSFFVIGYRYQTA